MNRKVLTAWIAVVVLVVMAAGLALAQRGPGHKRQMGPGGGFDLFGGRMLAHVEARLNLTAEQSQQIRQIMEQQRAQMRQQQAGRADHQALAQQIFSDNPNQAEIQKQVSAMQQRHAQRLEQMVATAAQINQVLTSEQRAELQKMLAEHQQAREKMQQRREERRLQRQQKRLQQ